MKKFVYKTILISTLIFIGVSLAFIFSDVILKKRISNTFLSNEVSILFSGDSHIVTSINDSIIPHSLNIANHGEQYLFTHNKLLKILHQNPHINTVFLGCSYHNFSNYLGKGIHKKSFALNCLYIIPINKQLKLQSLSVNPIRTFTKSLKSNISQLNSKEKQYWLGGYSPVINPSLIDSNCVISRIQNQFYNEKSVRSIFEENIFYLDKIINLLKTKGIALKIIKTPLAEEYKKNVPLNFKLFYDSIIKSNNLKLIDFKNLLMVKDDFLPDGDHLSDRGARKTSEYLKSLESNQH